MLTRFPAAMDKAVESVLRLAEVVRAISPPNNGDLVLTQVFQMQDALANAAMASASVLQEGSKALDAAQAHMRNVGGPTTLTDFGQMVQQFQTAADRWNTDLERALHAMTQAELVSVVRVTRGPASFKIVEFGSFIPARIADQLRQSPGLSALNTLLTNSGA